MKVTMTFDQNSEADQRQFEIYKQASKLFYAFYAFDAYFHEEVKTGTPPEDIRNRFKEILNTYNITLDL